MRNHSLSKQSKNTFNITILTYSVIRVMYQKCECDRVLICLVGYFLTYYNYKCILHGLLITCDRYNESADVYIKIMFFIHTQNNVINYSYWKTSRGYDDSFANPKLSDK